MLSLSVCVSGYLLPYSVSPFTSLVEISKKGKRSLCITGFITIIRPAEKRLMRLSSYWNLQFNKHQQSTWAGHREWPIIKKSLAWYLLNSPVQSKKIIPNMGNQSSLFLLLIELLCLLEKWALYEINCVLLTRNILKEIAHVSMLWKWQIFFTFLLSRALLEKKNK